MSEYQQLSTNEIESSLIETSETSQYINHEISKRVINWYGYKQQSYITDDTVLKQLTEFDAIYKQYLTSHTNDTRNKLLEYCNTNHHGTNVIVQSILLIDKIQAKETVEYIVVMIYTIIDLVESSNTITNQSNIITQLFSAQYNQLDLYTVFLQIISNLGSEKYHIDIINLASMILGAFISYEKYNGLSSDSTALVNYTRYINNKISSYNTNNNIKQLLHIHTQLKVLLRNSKAQDIFLSIKGLDTLATVLNNTQYAQHTKLLYLIGFNIWLLSYNQQILQQCHDSKLIMKLVNIVKSSSIEKITRIYYAIFKNLLLHIDGISPDTTTKHQHNTVDKKMSIELIEELIGSQLLQSAESALKRRYKDIDLVSDIEYVIQQLNSHIQQLSNFELYSSEVISGVLTWSPAHTNTQFWRENIMKFDGDDYKLIKQLIQLLSDPSDDIREIACHDIGEIAVYHPDGKLLINKFNGKPRLLSLLQDGNPRVRKQALLAIQKTLVQNWESLAKQSQQGVQSLQSQQQKK